MTIWFWVILGILALQRVGELLLNRRNMRRLVGRGGRLVKDDGFVLLAVTHVLFFVFCIVEALVSPYAGTNWWTIVGLAVFGGGEGLRAWSMVTLGDRWSTRVVIVPGRPLVASGPYKFMRHPIYLGVSLVLLGFPLAFGLWSTAVAITILNVIALRNRIRHEEWALESVR